MLSLFDEPGEPSESIAPAPRPVLLLVAAKLVDASVLAARAELVRRNIDPGLSALFLDGFMRGYGNGSPSKNPFEKGGNYAHEWLVAFGIGRAQRPEAPKKTKRRDAAEEDGETPLLQDDGEDADGEFEFGALSRDADAPEV